MTEIHLLVSDQNLSVTEKPVVATGAKKAVKTVFDFDGNLWNICGREAVFWNKEKPTEEDIIPVPLDVENSCEVPACVLTQEGFFYIGVIGYTNDGEIKKTSTIVKYPLKKGAPDGKGEVIEEPPDVWEQCLSIMGDTLSAAQEAINTASGAVGIANNALDTANDAVDTANRAFDSMNVCYVDEEGILHIHSLEHIDVLGDERLDAIESDIADLKYIAISVSSFGHNAGTKEKGDKVSSVVLSWVLNKEPVSLTVAGQTVTPAKSGSITVTDEISETKTFSLLATDEREATATKNTTINFYDGIYYGTAAKPEEVDSEFILSLTKILASGKNRTVNVNGGEGLYFFYAYPASLGTSIFNIGGFDYEFASETVSFENKFGVIKDYIVYVSDNPMLSDNSVTVKGG